MNMLKKIKMLLITGLLFAPAVIFSLEPPKLDKYVNDFAGMISSEMAAEIEGQLTAINESDSTQIVFLTIKSLDGEILEDFAIKTAEANGIGVKGKDNGILFLVVRDDRVMRIEVGRGLEGVVTDLFAGRIIDNITSPYFKSGDFDGGFNATADALIKAVKGEFKADDIKKSSDGSPKMKAFVIISFLIAFFVLPLLRKVNRVVGGVGGLCIGGVMGFIFIGLLPVVIIMGVVGLILGLIDYSSPFSSHGGHSTFWGGGGSSGGGFSGGGFSGGGGGFSGGGSSGGW